MKENSDKVKGTPKTPPPIPTREEWRKERIQMLRMWISHYMKHELKVPSHLTEEYNELVPAKEPLS